MSSANAVVLLRPGDDLGGKRRGTANSRAAPEVVAGPVGWEMPSRPARVAQDGDRGKESGTTQEGRARNGSRLVHGVRRGGDHAQAPRSDDVEPAGAPADAKTREGWLERLWEAHANDEIPYIERLGDFWGELCVLRETASAWADRLVRIVEMAWSPAPELRGFFHGTTACFSALLRAGRYEEILTLLEKAPLVFWPDRQWGVRALAALGRTRPRSHSRV